MKPCWFSAHACSLPRHESDGLLSLWNCKAKPALPSISCTGHGVWSQQQKVTGTAAVFNSYLKLCVCECEQSHTLTWAQRSEDSLWSWSELPALLETVSALFFCYVGQTSWSASFWEFPSLPLSLCKSMRIRHLCYMFNFYVGSGDSNLGL